MGKQIVELAGTPAGELLALSLALLAAMAHAIFGAINKGGMDPFLNRGAINLCYGVMAAPFALFVFPQPTHDVWLILGVAFFIHLLYEWLQAWSFHIGDFTLVYPISRGTGPLVTALFAGAVFGESLAPGQWAGLLLLSGSIMMLAFANVATARRSGRETRSLTAAILVALATGVMVSAYTTVDAFGARAAADPFTFLAWFFFLDGLGFPVLAYLRWRRLARRPPLGDLAVRGFFGAIIAFISFGALMLATRLGKVGEAAALRETSIIFATAIGVLIFRESIDARRLLIIGLIALGAILVEFH